MEELSLGKYDHTSFLPLHDFNTLQNKMRGLHLPMFVIFFFIMEYNNSELHLFSNENPQ